MKTNSIAYAVKFLLLLSLIFTSCTREELAVSPEKGGENTADPIEQNLEKSATKPNTVIVCLAADLAERINTQQADVLATPSSSLRAFSNELRSVGVRKLRRLFPEDKRFIQRYKQEGLDRWFVLSLNAQGSQMRAFSEIQTELDNISGIETIEPVYIVTTVDQPKLYIPIRPREEVGTEQTATQNLPFNDPHLHRQWHYNNTGELKDTKAGADINAFEAWKITTGTPNVIVDIVDGGIDTEHEDLKANLWVNTAELHGQPGIDDDGNGLIDDIHGWNYVSNKAQILPHMHGTHVAGTVAAVNNNGIGVCGVAGGNGSPDSGVRLMSSQIFEPSSLPQGQDMGTDDLPAAMVYGANNGAVISQNSWGFQNANFTETPKHIRLAIDYFIKYAGVDKAGNQVGPMKGGIVIFAAGNEYVEKLDFPSSYPPVFAVAAMAPNFRRATYSTHGDWVDISAPGGDQQMVQGYERAEYGVYSTFPGNRYGYLDGTSMACPHVSGVAALLVSKFGGPGFTNDMLKELLLHGAQDIYIENKDKAGKLGKGYLDAAKAMQTDHMQPPAAVETLEIVDELSGLTARWPASADPDDGYAFLYYLCASKKPIEGMPELDNPPAEFFIQKVRGPRGQKTVTGKIAPLPIGETMHLMVIAEDRWGHRSAAGTQITGVVKNANPIISLKDAWQPIRITGTEYADVDFIITDPDNDPIEISLAGEASTATLTKTKDNQYSLHLTAVGLSPGTYTLTLVVKDAHYNSELPENDPHNGLSKYSFTFEVYENSAPVEKKALDVIYLGYGNQKKIFLERYFTDPDGHSLSYYVLEHPDKEICLLSFNGDQMVLSGLKVGTAKMSLQVQDTQQGILKKDLRIVVSNAKLLYGVEPLLIEDFVKIRLNDDLEGLLALSIYDSYGQRMLRRVLNVTEEKLITLDLSKWPAGTYILKAENDQASEKLSILKK